MIREDVLFRLNFLWTISRKGKRRRVSLKNIRFDFPCEAKWKSLTKICTYMNHMNIDLCASSILYTFTLFLG